MSDPTPSEPRPKPEANGGCFELAVILLVASGAAGALGGVIYFCIWFIAVAWSAGAS